jgi:peroxiredoxin
MKNLSARKVDYRAFQERRVQVLGIAAEHSFSQRPFADSLHLPYALLSDYPAFTVIQRYTGLQPHPSDPHRMAARRTLVLIDIQGIVRWQWQGETTDVFPSALILQRTGCKFSVTPKLLTLAKA